MVNNKRIKFYIICSYTNNVSINTSEYYLSKCVILGKRGHNRPNLWSFFFLIWEFVYSQLLYVNIINVIVSRGH